MDKLIPTECTTKHDDFKSDLLTCVVASHPGCNGFPLLTKERGYRIDSIVTIQKPKNCHFRQVKNQNGNEFVNDRWAPLKSVSVLRTQEITVISRTTIRIRRSSKSVLKQYFHDKHCLITTTRSHIAWVLPFVTYNCNTSIGRIKFAGSSNTLKPMI